MVYKVNCLDFTFRVLQHTSSEVTADNYEKKI